MLVRKRPDPDFAELVWKKIDTDKLREHRELVDEEVSRLVIGGGTSRPIAYKKLLANLEVELALLSGRVGWLGLILRDGMDEQFNESGRTARAAGSTEERIELLACFLTKFLANTLVFGDSPDEIAVAAALLALDPRVDIFDTHCSLLPRVPNGEWLQVFGISNYAVEFPDSLPGRIDRNQRLLFESDDEFVRRSSNQSIRSILLANLRSATESPAPLPN